MSLKICHISSMHYQNDDRIFERASQGSVREGYDVTYIVTYPEDTVLNGVKIVALKERSGIKKRIISSYEAYKKALAGDYDIYQFHDPELLPFMVLLKWKGKTVLYDIHENYVVRFRYRGLPRFIEKTLMYLWHKFEAFCVSQYDGIIPVTESMGDLFKKQAKETLVISNMVDIELMKDTIIPEPKTKENLMCFSGYISMNRNPIQIIEAMPMILKEVPDAKMLFSGKYVRDCDEIMKAKIAELNLEKSVIVGGWLPWRENFNRIAQSLIGCVFWKKDENYSITIPAKIFEYMYCSIAVLSDNTVELAKVVNASNCGLLLNSDDPKQIAEAAIKLFKNRELAIQMGINGRKAMHEKFNFNMQLKEMLAFYHKILAKRK